MEYWLAVERHNAIVLLAGFYSLRKARRQMIKLAARSTARYVIVSIEIRIRVQEVFYDGSALDNRA